MTRVNRFRNKIFAYRFNVFLADNQLISIREFILLENLQIR